MLDAIATITFAIASFSDEETITMKKALIPALALSALTIAVWPSNSLQADSAVFQDAKALYASKCATCHSLDGSGTTATGKKMKLRDLRSAEVQNQTDDQLEKVIAKGKGKMTGYEKSIGPEKVKQLVAYMRELAKK
jgi:mono/diheme cytochrome c family protein